MPEKISDKDYLKNIKKPQWLVSVICFAIFLATFKDIVVNVKDIYTIIKNSFDVNDEIVDVISMYSANVESELITDSHGIYFVSSTDYGFSHERINPFSKEDITKALMNENLFVDASGGIPVGLRVANANEKILNIEEIRVNLESYEEIYEQEFYNYAYVYSGAANTYYDYYSVTLEPERKTYNALASPSDFEYGLYKNLDSISPLGRVYYPISPGHTEYVALYITPKDPGIYSFRLSVKYSIDGMDDEMLASKIFRVISLPSNNAMDDIPSAETPSLSPSDNLSPVTSFPKASCGDQMPHEMSHYPLKMYPIFIRDEKDNLSRVKNEFCGDAYPNQRYPGMIQVASFYDRQAGHSFAILMENEFGYSVTGPAYEFRSPDDREPEAIPD